MGSDAGREIELQAGALRLAGRAWGAAAGPPVLALHGWLDNAATFDRLAPLLEGLHVVAPDLPGHGHSDHRPAGCGYHFVDFVADTVAAVDALGWDRFSLLGHSMGGGVATFVAGACPERVARLALIEAFGPLTADPVDTPDRLAEALARAGRKGRGPAPVYADLDEAIEARRVAGGLSAEAARPLVERGTVAAADGLRWRADPRVRLPGPHRFTEQQVLAVLGAIRAPTLFVTATDGRLPQYVPHFEERIAAVHEHCHHSLPGHHHLHLEDPGPVAAVLQPFLTGRSGTSG